MQITPWLIYWIDVIHSICVLGNILVAVGLVLLSAACMAQIDPKNTNGTVNEVWKVLLCLLGVGAAICVFVPSKTVMMQMLILPPVVNNEQVQQLPSNVLEYVNNWLEEANAELKEKKK